MGLVALQILIPMLPSEPPIIVGAFAYGFLNGFLLIWLVATAATQLVFYLVRRAGRPFAERFVPVKKLEK